ncbi:MAG: dimethylargininase [Acidobacteriia bacterium]|nr:dimethylargininase [Terriglobia bacterium]
MLTAITRGVSPALHRCELGFLPRQKIELKAAEQQHSAYEEHLRALGVTVVSLPPEPDLPDSMFVEDPAVVVPEVAIMTRMGAESRRGEAESLGAVLARYRPLRWMREPATLEGGDVLRIGGTLFVGHSHRTNLAGIEQIASELHPFGYTVKAVAVRGCLHLKSACCSLGARAVLANRNWIDAEAFQHLEIIDVPPEEPHGSNILVIGDTVLVAASFPRTAALIERLGWKVRTIEISELQKAEAGLTCSSILLDSVH